MVKSFSKGGRFILCILLAISFVLLFFAPKEYSLSFCIECFSVFLIDAFVLLSNNIKKYKTMILFESLFSISFFLVNYAYPVFIFSSNTPYFSLFLYNFNEDVISKSTALATVGYCSYSLFQYEIHNVIKENMWYKDAFSKVSTFEILLLFVLFISYIYNALPALIGGYSYSEGAGFFRILSIFLCFKRIYNWNVYHPISRDIVLWGMIALYIIVNLMVGNRGDPLYVAMAIFISYTYYVRKLSNRFFVTVIAAGMAIFFIIGQARVRYGDTDNYGSMLSRVKDVQRDEYEGGVLMYGKELIINNRSLYVLVDYADREGLNYGQSWQLNIYSIVPFLQSIMLKLTGISPELSASVNLTTYLEFGRGDPDAFGLGTNLIGDIYICFGGLGVVIFMALLGYVIRITYRKSCFSSCSALIFICFFVFSVYYPRASYLEPIRLIVWSYILYKITFKRITNHNLIVE